MRLLSNMDVNMVMHVHRKHCDTQPFKSLLHIVANMCDEAQTVSKEQGRSLPDWPMVAALTRKSPSSLAENSGISELDQDGSITDQHFAQAGFGPNIGGFLRMSPPIPDTQTGGGFSDFYSSGP